MKNVLISNCALNFRAECGSPGIFAVAMQTVPKMQNFLIGIVCRIRENRPNVPRSRASTATGKIPSVCRGLDNYRSDAEVRESAFAFAIYRNASRMYRGRRYCPRADHHGV